MSNSIFDRTIGPDRFGLNTPTAKDPRWWGGEPIWTTAIRQGQKSASMFWPGSEAVHPTYWKPYDDAFPNAERVKQVLDWMALPDAERPSLITLYFSDVDSAAHRAGPESDDALAAAARLDDLVGRLVSGLEQSGALARTTIVVVSDHGLAETSLNRLILLDDYVVREDVEVVDLGASMSLNPGAKTDADTIFRQLAGKHPSLTVYRKAELPPALHYGSHPRVPAIVGLVEGGWTVTWRDNAIKNKAAGRTIGGAHGYAPTFATCTASSSPPALAWHKASSCRRSRTCISMSSCVKCSGSPLRRMTETRRRREGGLNKDARYGTCYGARYDWVPMGTRNALALCQLSCKVGPASARSAHRSHRCTFFPATQSYRRVF